MIALVEGAVILGFLTFLAPSLETVGFSPAVAGLAVGLYGLAVLGWTRVVKLVANRLGASVLILICDQGMLHALIADQKLPQTKEEAERENPNWAHQACGANQALA